MSPEELKKILEKYDAGECNPEELLIIGRFFKVIENNTIPIFKDDSDRNHVEINLKNRIDQEIEQTGRMFPNFFKISNAFKFAAVAMLVIGMGLGFLFQKDNTKNAVIGLVTYTTMNGEKEDLVLSDGTKVHLNSGSNFKVPRMFSGEKRVVYLEGEAFFEVSKNDKMPFLIVSEKLSIQVVGTSFNVKAFRSNKNIETVVMTGKVKVFDKNTEVILNPNQKAVYDKASGGFKTQTVKEVNNYHAWMKNVLVFEKKSMEEIIKDLNRHFNVEIKLETSKVKNFELNVRFEDDSLETILQILCSYTESKYIRKGNKITIK